ncbi:MAG TPA: hypothetical protein VKY40_07785, partial [Halanaerobiales bacterium]|nr:hypothetical protein [Halanaerobiales bacterium]
GLFRAKEKALAGLLSQLDDGIIINSIYQEVLESGDEKIRLRLIIKTEENIACLKEDFSGRN